MDEKFDNLTTEKMWCDLFARARMLEREEFLSIVSRILNDPLANEPYTPSDKDCMPQGPYIPLALRK